MGQMKPMEKEGEKPMEKVGEEENLGEMLKKKIELNKLMMKMGFKSEEETIQICGFLDKMAGKMLCFFILK